MELDLRAYCVQPCEKDVMPLLYLCKLLVEVAGSGCDAVGHPESMKAPVVTTQMLGRRELGLKERKGMVAKEGRR